MICKITGYMKGVIRMKMKYKIIAGVLVALAMVVVYGGVLLAGGRWSGID